MQIPTESVPSGETTTLGSAYGTLTDANKPMPSLHVSERDDSEFSSREETSVQLTAVKKMAVMAAVGSSLFLAALDMTVVSTAVPKISSDFGSSGGYIWIGTSYLLGTASFIPIWGKASDIYGPKAVFLNAVGIFVIGSALCGASVSMSMLVGFRAFQGIGAGALLVLPNVTISDLFSQRQRSKYLGMLGIVWAVAAAIGPLVGGAFSTRVSWRWCFYINIPIGVVAFAIISLLLKLHQSRTPLVEGLKAIDWIGSLLIIGGTAMLLIGLESGGSAHPWNSAIVISLIISGVATILAFITYEATVAKYPIIPPSLFRNRTSAAAYSLSFIHAFSYMGGLYWMPLYFQSCLSVTSFLSGVYLLPFVLSLSFMFVATGFYTRSSGNYKFPIICGFCFMTLGFGLFITLGVGRNWAKIILFQAIAGFGLGPNFQAPLLAIQTNVEPGEIGSATATAGFLRQLGTAVSVVVGGIIFNNEMYRQHGMLVESVGTDLAALFGSAEAAANVRRVASLPSDTMKVVQYAYWAALRNMYILYTSLGLFAVIVSLLVVQKVLSEVHHEHKTGLDTLRLHNHKTGPHDEESGGRS